MEPTLAQALFLSTAALVAGTVDAIAGGGGLISVPALLATGLPPALALGTNKAQSSFGTAAALVRFARAGLVDRQRAPLAFALGVTGSLGGAALLLALKPEVLRPIVLILLLAVAVITFRGRRPAATDEIRPVKPRWVVHLFTLLIGAYDGFFGPGTGLFLITGFVGLAGEALSQASANAKVVNLASNLAALALFAVKGTVVWSYALPMLAAQLVGGWLGAHLAVRVGDRLVRPVVLVISLALVVKVGWSVVTGS